LINSEGVGQALMDGLKAKTRRIAVRGEDWSMKFRYSTEKKWGRNMGSVEVAGAEDGDRGRTRGPAREGKKTHLRREEEKGNRKSGTTVE